MLCFPCASRAKPWHQPFEIYKDGQPIGYSAHVFMHHIAGIFGPREGKLRAKGDAQTSPCFNSALLIPAHTERIGTYRVRRS